MNARATPLRASKGPRSGELHVGGLYVGDCLPLLARLPDASIDLTVTSPPYDELRRYDMPTSLDLTALRQQLLRVTREGGLCVLVIGDSARHYSKSLTSFRLAVSWCDAVGWRLFECCLYHRHGTPGPWWRTRFRVDHEFILLLLKGDRPRAFHKEALYVPTKHAGEHVSYRPFPRQGRPWGSPPPTVQPLQCRGTVWPYATSSAERNRLKLGHPATMPDRLAADLIACFSDPSDLVLDPLMGSGTTCVMAARLGRRYVGMDALPAYVEIARRRLAAEAGKRRGRKGTGAGMDKAALWHPVPLRLVDEVMSRLRDTELRVLLVVLRQTWGWRADRLAGDAEGTAGRKHKRRDWLSHRQLCRCTGRSSDGVSGAVASLVEADLLVVEDAVGKALQTAEERRRFLGRLYFRPSDMWGGVEMWKTSGKSRPVKAETTTHC